MATDHCNKTIRPGQPWLCSLPPGHQGGCISEDSYTGFEPIPPKHTCHAKDCSTPVPPRLLMCFHHWKMVPRDIQSAVWRHYVQGQKITKTPTREYLEVMKLAIDAVAAKEGK